MRRLTLSAVAAATVVATLAGASPAQADQTYTGMQATNRMDGSHLALYADDSISEGVTAVSLRSPSWKFQTAAWTITRKDINGMHVLRNAAANKCLQPSSSSPVAGTTVIVRSCDGSALQEWSLRNEETDAQVTATGWYSLRPAVNTKIALTLDTYQGSGSLDTLILNEDLNSADRLWRFHKQGATWWT
jgi:hypothetical protein